MDAELPKPAQPNRQRRWFQFRLRTLFVVVTMLALACAAVRLIHERDDWSKRAVKAETDAK